MIDISATFEVSMCLIAAMIVGCILLWLFGSIPVALASGIGVFCWALDGMFSYKEELDWDDDESVED